MTLRLAEDNDNTYYCDDTRHGGEDIHVYPAHDAVPHVTCTECGCLCGPHTDPVQRDDGSYGWVIVHHSLDGREANE